MRKLLALLTLALCAVFPSINGFSHDFYALGLFRLIEPAEASAANVVLASLFVPLQKELNDSAPTSSEQAAPKIVSIEQVCHAVAEAASAQGIPTGFLARLIWQESRFDPQARSPAGALGVAQFMPRTAEAFGLDDPHDPIRSVAASARFLRQLRDQFGNLGLAAAAYNAGSGRVSKWLKGQEQLPTETENYVRIITGSAARRWTLQDPVDLHVALPHRAPCEGIGGLSRTNNHARLIVSLSMSAATSLEQAEAERRARLAAQRMSKSKKALIARTAKGANRKIRAA